jgi:hypothetical protein
MGGASNFAFGRPLLYYVGMRPTCEVCNKRPVGKAGTGGRYWRKKCDQCRRGPKYIEQKKRRDILRKSPWRAYLKESCERCGFVPEHPSQLDIDHVDGHKENTDPSNYMTLCANCHRLKTILCNEYGPKSARQ